MLQVVGTLITRARVDETTTDRYAVDLLNHKIREAGAALANAKQTLASIIIHKRTEHSNLQVIEAQISDLEKRATAALSGGNEKLAVDAAAAIASLENERATRQKMADSLKLQAQNMRLSVESINRRMIDLKQGAICAQAVDAEHQAQRSMTRIIGSASRIREAKDLLKSILGRDEPLAETTILDEIDQDIGHVSLVDRLAEAGFGAAVKVRAKDVLKRIRTAATAH